MTIAKRRSYAYAITHGTPPFANADLYGEYSELEQLLHEYEEERDAEKKRALLSLMEEKCRGLRIKLDGIEELHAYLYELKKSAIPKGLHVLGGKWSDEDVANYLSFVLKRDGDVKALTRLIVEEQGLNYDEVISSPGRLFNGVRVSEVLERAEKLARDMISLIMSGEKPEAIAKKHFKRLRGEALETLGYARTLYERIKRGNEVEAILEALSGLRRTIEAISGRRVDALWIDTTCVRDSVKSAEEAVESWARSRLLNPKWINAMLEHGYDGTREAMKRVEYLLGHAALTKAVEEWIWTEVARTYVLNDEVRERMKRSNPWALHRIMRVLHEARERGYWRPSKELLEKLEKLFIEVDGLLEEVSS